MRKELIKSIIFRTCVIASGSFIGAILVPYFAGNPIKYLDIRITLILLASLIGGSAIVLLDKKKYGKK
jgi:hypothetical protein